MPEELRELEREIAARLAARQAAMERDLAEFVAIPTGTGHEPGLALLRGVFRARLAALSAEVSGIAGDPKPAWITQPGQASDAAPPASLRAVARGGTGRAVL
ncbi:MAG: hypothetical protein LW636_05115, partial [Planctomycetaceae bacterium]|nr:hypothetical protein [Planctomycetaceae bacterium]